MDLKQLKNQITAEYKFRIELHAHTSPVSGCSQVLPKDMVETYKALGYDAVAITNHFLYRSDRDKNEYLDWYLNDYLQTEQFGRQLGLKVYLGAEIRFTENMNDYLVFGVDRKILSDIYDLLPYGVENFRKNYSMPDSIFIQAHPMRDGIVRVDRSLLDGIEVYNMHPNHNSRVGQVAVYAKEMGLSVITAGSDYHHPNMAHEGVAALRSACLPEDTYSLVKLLKSGDYLLEIGRNNIVIP